MTLTTNIETPDPREKFHIYLCFGQSNMGGQAWDGTTQVWNGFVPDQYKQNIPDNFLVMAAANINPDGRNKGEWYKAVPPLCRAANGLGPADYFGRTLLAGIKDPDIKAGVIVVAVDGCAIDLFQKDNEKAMAYLEKQQDYMKDQAALYDNNPYQRLVEMAKIARTEGVIKGIVTHHGESGGAGLNWSDAVKDIYNDLRTDLGIEEEIPLLAGQAYGNNNINISRLPQALPDVARVISSAGCSSGGDNLHFSYDGYKLLGERYGRKMLEILGY